MTRGNFVLIMRPPMQELAGRLSMPATGLLAMLLVEADHRDGTLRCSGREISLWYGWHRSSVERALHELEALGFIRWEPERQERTRDATLILPDYSAITGTLTGTPTGTLTGSESDQPSDTPQAITPDSEGGQEVQDLKTLSLDRSLTLADAEKAASAVNGESNEDWERKRQEWRVGLTKEQADAS